jgi:hypothetical protein
MPRSPKELAFGGDRDNPKGPPNFDAGDFLFGDQIERRDVAKEPVGMPRLVPS